MLLKNVLTTIDLFEDSLFLYAPAFYNNFLMHDRYSCQENSIKNTKSTVAVTDILSKTSTKTCKLCIIFYNAVYLHKLHLKVHCGI